MFRLLRCLFLVAGLPGLLRVSAPAREPAPDWWGGLAVRDLSGAPVPLTGRWIVVVFISPECPVANGAIPVLNALAADFAPDGVSFVGAYADPSLAPAVIRKHAAEYRIDFATADDRDQRLARATQAAYTPEAFVFSRDGTLLYRGRIDDRVRDFGAARPRAAHQDLREVLSALVAGRPVPFATRPGFGCSIPDPVRQ